MNLDETDLAMAKVPGHRISVGHIFDLSKIPPRIYIDENVEEMKFEITFILYVRF